MKEANELFKDRHEALQYLNIWVEACECEDDVVDEEKSVALIERLGRLKFQLHNCPYWKRYGNSLFLVERLIYNTYYDSVKWESADEEWKRRDAKCLSHTSYNMLFAVILIEFGEETLSKWSIKFREYAHLKHLNDER